MGNSVGGYGGGCASDTGNDAANVYSIGFGTPVGVTPSGTATKGQAGIDSRLLSEDYVTRILDRLVSAPVFGEFHFVSTIPATGGYGGFKTTTATGGGAGGNGWRGSGGAGGGGAGVAGTSGGAGGVGGNGVVYLFYEEM